jgi:hypothetical protein
MIEYSDILHHCRGDDCSESIGLGLTENSWPPFAALEKHLENPGSLSEREMGEIGYFYIAITILEKADDPKDKAGVEYYAKLLRHYCPWGMSFEYFSATLQEKMLPTYTSFPPGNSYIEAVLTTANCTKPN